MTGFKSTNSEVEYKHQRIVRVAVYFNNDTFSTGTGFFVSESGKILTCWHVLFGMDLKIFKLSEEFMKNNEEPEAQKIDRHLKNKIVKIEIEKPDGGITTANLVTYDYFYDLAIVQIVKGDEAMPFFEIETDEFLDYADEVNFCGYPECEGYNTLNSPFAVNTGVVSAFPEVEIAGGKYKNIQLNSICIGGNSGAPLFKNGNLKVHGVVNGYQWKGKDRVPINISFATGFDLLKLKSIEFAKECI